MYELEIIQFQMHLWNYRKNVNSKSNQVQMLIAYLLSIKVQASVILNNATNQTHVGNEELHIPFIQIKVSLPISLKPG